MITGQRPMGGHAREDGAISAHAAEYNRILRSIPSEEYMRLLPRMVPTRLRFRHVIAEPHTEIRDVYFVRDGAVSLIVSDPQEGEVEAGTIGSEGLVGFPILLEATSYSTRVLVQIEGDAWRLDAAGFHAALAELPTLRRMCLRFVAYYTAQLSQSVACNRLHTLEERCARWLLMTHDRVQRPDFELTHEFMAAMLGVRRAGVTVAMGALQHAGMVRYARGRISVLDRAALERASCPCYAITRQERVTLFGDEDGGPPPVG